MCILMGMQESFYCTPKKRAAVNKTNGFACFLVGIIADFQTEKRMRFAIKFSWYSHFL